MLDIIENPEEVNRLKDETKAEVIEDLAHSLRKKFHGMFPDTVGDGRGSSVWAVSRQTYCDDEWSELIKSLRLADDDIRHVRFTNSYVEQRLNEYCDELKDMRKTSDMVAEKLNELSKTDIEFTRAVSAYLSRTVRKEQREDRNMKFRCVARKSKSAECSMHRMCSSCGLMLKESVPRRDKYRRRREYGKYCSTCGAVEVPSQNSMIRCRDCNGEIILQGLCSSCDSLDVGKQFKTCAEPREKVCSTCEYLKRRIWLNDKSQCRKGKPRKESVFFCKHTLRKDYEESSCCSDCGFTSSCDVPALTHTPKRNMSADSLIPRSDSDNFVSGARSCSCDYDISSSMSSFDPGKSSLVPFVCSRVEESETSIDEDYATPREYLSSEEVSTEEINSATSVESTLVGVEDACEETNSDEYVEAEEPEETTVQQPIMDDVCGRLHRAEEALGDITTGNLKLEEGILTMEDISQQNLKLSLILRDIVMGMTDRLNQIQQVRPKDESESSDEYEEAVTDAKTDPETETFYEIQPPSHCYLCLECGIGMSHRELSTCPNCERKLAEIPRGFFDSAESSSRSTGRELVPAHCVCKNWKLSDAILSAFPVLVRGNFPAFPLESVEDRLKLIERETNLLRDNNEIINLFVDDFKTKLQRELECVQSVCTRKGDVGETTIVGFDVSFYQFTRHITERRTSEETVTEQVEEEVCQQRKTFVEMKFEEVYKKEQQTAVELEIFEQKLEVEGLIIKEKEDFFTCSNASQAVEEANSLPLTQMFASEKFPIAERGVEKDNLLISIEIEVEKEKKAIRCEYKANLQKKRLEQERTLPTITLYPVWPSNRAVLGYNSGESGKAADFTGDEPFSIDIERDDFVEIKSPNCFSASSDDEDGEEWYKQCITGNAVSAVAMHFPMHTVTEIPPRAIPFAVLNVLTAKKEFSRVSQIELNHSPESGVVFLQTEAVSSLSVIDCHQDESFEEFFEARSRSDTSFQQSSSTLRKSLVRFVPIDLGVTSVASIPLADETLPIVVTDEVKPVSVPELTTALSLIREIENDVVEVKLHNAIAILPQLESVLREHLQGKMKVLKEKSSTMSSASLDVFMSTLNFLAEDGEEREPELREIESEERLGKILNLLTGLEDAVREINATEDGNTNCGKPERIYDMLRDLGSRIEGIGGDLDMSAVEETLQLTSDLDVAVRNYSCDVISDAKTPDCAPDVGESIITADMLRSMRKKIFEIVTLEAEERDARIEENMGRIEKLEKENFEVMRFLDTLLDKTLRRVSELDDIRKTAILLRNDIEDLILKTEEERSFTRSSGARIGLTPTLPSIQEVSSDCRTNSEEENVRETLSGMIVTLDNLKTKAKEKTEKYKEIFGDERDSGSWPITLSDGLGVTSSRSSDMQSEEGGKSRITEFSRIGANTYFMAWTKPKDVSEDSPIVGFEIWVNGKVNQRVRNPERLKAVLYSVHPVHPGGKLRIRLFALTEDGRRSSLADLRYPEEGS